MSKSMTQESNVCAVAEPVVASGIPDSSTVTPAGQTTRASVRNVLFLTDFSPHSEAALPYAMAVASLHGSQVYVAHAVLPDRASAFDAAWRRAADRLQHISLRLPEIPSQVLLRQGELGQVFSDLIEYNDIDLVVLGVGGRSGSWISMLGQIADQIYRRSPLPVLVVGPEVQPKAAGEVGFRRILCATDFQRAADNALAYGLLLAQEWPDLILVHVLKGNAPVPRQEEEEIRNALRERLRQRLRMWCHRSWKAEFAVETGRPAERIVAAAAHRRADLILLGLRRASPGSGALLQEGTAHQVVSQAHCPVLCVASQVA